MLPVAGAESFFGWIAGGGAEGLWLAGTPGRWTSVRVTKGRGRPTARLMVRQIQLSPSGRSNANQSPGPAFPDQRDRQQREQWVEKNVAAGKRHEHVENRIRQLAIDETKQADIQCLEPLHCFQIRD
jgi:hypothetical protein